MNSGKSKKRLNVIDVLIILLVVALVATVAYRIYAGVSEKRNGLQSRYIVTFECDSEYSSMLKYLTVGKAVYFCSSGDLLGYLYDADKEDGIDAVYEIKNGDSANSESSDGAAYDYHKVRFTGQLKLDSETVKVRNGGYFSIGGSNITEGSVISVFTDEAEFTLRVISITEPEQ